VSTGVATLASATRRIPAIATASEKMTFLAVRLAAVLKEDCLNAFERPIIEMHIYVTNRFRCNCRLRGARLSARV
jgi:hypothetical protein